MEQTLPGKPDYLTTEEYNFVITRDRRRCVMRDQCLASRRLGTEEFCSMALDLDHHHPGHLGGDDSFANVRLLCCHENRGRPETPSPYWERLNYWDGDFNWSKLRDIQALASHDAVLDPELLGFPYHHRKPLLRTVTIKVGATGIGKTIELVATLFALNQSVNSVASNRPRVSHVLWLTTDQTLRDATKQELEDELHEIGLVQTRPTVRVANNYSDLLKADGADITVSCAQTLWKVGEDDPRRTGDELREALQHFDTIIFDEVDFASEQVQHIVDHATNALKFSLTASPPIMNSIDPRMRERCMSRFVMIDKSAVADYQRAITLDGCLKRLTPDDDPTLVSVDDLIVPCANHDSHEILYRGDRVTANTIAEPDHVSYLAAIMKVVYEADELEQDMRRDCPNDWYSPHIMVRVGSIADIRALLKVLPAMLDDAKDKGRLKGDGWGATGIFQGCEQHVPPDEHDLSAKRRGRHRHPFMRAKDNRGQAKAGCKRILLMCNIGVRGINNWPILFIVDNTDIVSLQSLIQLIGRAIRWPRHLVAWHGNLNLQRYLEVKLYIPQCLLTPAKRSALEEALKFIVNMEEEVAAAGFRTWRDLADGTSAGSIQSSFLANAQTLTHEDELKIIDTVGGLLIGNHADTAMATVGSIFDGTKTERAQRLVEGLLQDKDYRARKLGTAHVLTVDPIARLKPKDHYDADELIRFVKQSPAYDNDRAAYVQAIIDQSQPLYIKLLEKDLRDEQVAHYGEPSRRWQLQKENGELGLLTDLANELRREIGNYLRDPNRVYAAVNHAACLVFGISTERGGAKNNGPMNEHPYHVAIIGRSRHQIKTVAQNKLAEWGVWPNRQKLLELN